MKFKQIIIILFALGVTFSACTSTTTKQKEDQQLSSEKPLIEVLELDTYLKQLNEEIRPHHFVDVRTPEEVAEGTISDASNIDYTASDFIEKIKTLDKDQPIYLFCRSGNRSGKASQVLAAEGFKEIYDLKGGYLEYSAHKE